MLVLLVLQLVFYIKNKKFANLVVCATWILSSLSLVLVVPSILIYVELFKTDFLNVIKDNIPYMVCLLVIIIGYIIGVLSVIFGLISCKAEKAEEVVLEEANEEVPISSSEPTEEVITSVEEILEKEEVKEEIVPEVKEETKVEEKPKVEEQPKVEVQPKVEEQPVAKPIYNFQKRKSNAAINPKKEEKVEEQPKVEVKTETKKDDSAVEKPRKTATKKVVEKVEAKEEIKTPTKPSAPLKVYHINKRKEDNKWTIKFNNGERVIKLFNTKVEALAYAEDLASRQNGTVLVHASKGKNKGKVMKK